MLFSPQWLCQVDNCPTFGTALSDSQCVACLAGTFDYDSPMPTLTQLLERGKDDVIAMGAPGRQPHTYADLRRHVTEGFTEGWFRSGIRASSTTRFSL